jgi:hypothetical protein
VKCITASEIFWGGLRGNACDDQQDAQSSGKEARFEHKHPEGKEPKAPEYLNEEKSRAVKIEERHSLSIVPTGKRPSPEPLEEEGDSFSSIPAGLSDR